MERAVEAPAQGASKPVERRGGASLGKKPWELLSRSTKEEESSLLHLPAFVLALQSSFTYLQFGPCRLIQLRNGTDRNAISRHFQRSF